MQLTSTVPDMMRDPSELEIPECYGTSIAFDLSFAAVISEQEQNVALQQNKYGKKLEMVLWSKELSVLLLWYAWQQRRSLENCGWKRDMLNLVFTGCFVSVFCVKISLIDRKWTDLSHAVASGSNQPFHTGDLLLGYVICAAGMIEFDKFPWNKLICLYRSEKDFLLFLIYFFILNVKVL